MAAKKQAARKRWWKKFLCAQGKEVSMPSKWVDTRWNAWPDVADWWLEHFSLFSCFVELEIKKVKTDNPSKEPPSYMKDLNDFSKSHCFHTWLGHLTI